MSELIVDIKELHKYFGKLEVLKGINMQVHESEVVCLIGPSGAGKSTLLRCINRLEEPTRGRILVNGQEVTAPRANLNEIRSEIGMVFQHFNLFPHMSALQNCTLALIKVRRLNKSKAEERAMKMLRRVGLEEKAKNKPRQLSGGQQQRVAIARALAMDPKLMLFDEPTSALDPELIGEVLDVMLDLAGKGMTMVVVTHEMGFARQATTRIMMLDSGIILEQGPPDQIFENPTHSRTREFLSKIF
ncbi:MAG: amino acid ABC transporter ATP-binding protein [Candidatus Bipolaricaulota bacterium]|nr:amino acid ABC transporter ATP-binding protein [Candidatus Bipolaricaulota bacterium]